MIIRPVERNAVHPIQNHAVSWVVIWSQSDGAVTVHDGSFGAVVLGGIENRLKATLRMRQRHEAQARSHGESKPASELDSILNVRRHHGGVDVRTNDG